MDLIFKGTPGPWRWELNEKHKDVQLCGGVPNFDLTVMDFVRYGTSGAAPSFNNKVEEGFNVMERAEKFGEKVKGREHHAHWFKTINHPDANLIAAAPDLLAAAIDFIEKFKQGEIDHHASLYKFEKAVNKALIIKE